MREMTQKAPPLLISTLQFAESKAAPRTHCHPLPAPPNPLLGLRATSGTDSSNTSHQSATIPSGLPTSSHGIYYLFPSISINNMELGFHDGLHNK